MTGRGSCLRWCAAGGAGWAFGVCKVGVEEGGGGEFGKGEGGEGEGLRGCRERHWVGGWGGRLGWGLMS